MFETDNNEDIIDSRDIIARIEELEEREDYWSEPHPTDDDTQVYADGPLDEDETAELASLRALAEQGEMTADWIYGVTLVRDSYFEEYAEGLAEELNGETQTHTWPHNHIDWEAAAADLQQDYTDIDYDGVTYWAR